MTNVTTHARFGANINDLKDKGIDVTMHQTAEDLSDILLEEAKYGEMLAGDLTDEERGMFVELYRSNTQLEKLGRDYMGAAIERVGNKIRQSDATKSLTEAFKEEPQQMDFGTPENQLEFFRIQNKIKILNASLWWSVSERLNLHDWQCSVRSRYRVYKVACKAF